MPQDSVVFLFDVDNTLLDNDRVTADLMRYLEREVGVEPRQHYLQLFEELRSQLGYADYLGAFQRYRDERPLDHRIIGASLFLIDYPFAARLFPQSLDVLERCARWGTVALLSDGDVVFQPHKIERAGLRQAVADHVLIYVHKEQALDDVEQRHQADHYVVIDDKVRLLAATKRHWNTRVTTVFPRQGHYAHDDAGNAAYPTPDLTIERIGDLMQYDLSNLLALTRPAQQESTS